MIKLKVPCNLKGGLVAAGSVLPLPEGIEKKMVESGTAEYFNPVSSTSDEKKDSLADGKADNLTVRGKPIDKATKAELIEIAASLGVKDITDTMTKAEIIARIEANGKS